MLLKFGTPCRSRGEHLGTLWGVTVEAGERLLLRVIVEEPQATPLARVRVPFGRLEVADSDHVVLALSEQEFRALPPHEGDGARRRAPAASGRRRRAEEAAERVLTASARVHCREGEVGMLSAVSVDSRSGDLEDISFSMGMPLTREVVIPAQHVEEIRDDRVQLSLGMNDLAEFPSRRPF